MAEQIGLEKTPEEYITALVGVFREVRRVLRPDGTLWLNLGDSYARQGGKTDGVPRHWDGRERDPGGMHAKRAVASDFGAKPKDLVGIPWRVAFALQADGWYLRSDIIWHKPNPMPESVRDRPTKAHEYVFLLTKSAKYFYDYLAIAEPTVTAEEAKWDNGEDGHGGGVSHAGQGSSTRKFGTNPNVKNARTIWTISPQPFRGAHFATMPPALAERCIRAGTSERGCCAQCGASYSRIVKRTKMEVAPGPSREERSEGGRLRTQTNGTMTKPPTAETVGWKPGCKCGADVEPCTVLDPFGGASTTAFVADQLGRHGISIELNPEYIEIGRRRFS